MFNLNVLVCTDDSDTICVILLIQIKKEKKIYQKKHHFNLQKKNYSWTLKYQWNLFKQYKVLKMY